MEDLSAGHASFGGGGEAGVIIERRDMAVDYGRDRADDAEQSRERERERDRCRGGGRREGQVRREKEMSSSPEAVRR